LISVIGHSANPIMSHAAEEIVHQCMQDLRGLSPDIGFLFTSRMDQDYTPLLDTITKEWPQLELVGCTTDGEISDKHPGTEDSICLLLISARNITFSVGVGSDLSLDPEAAVRSAIARIGPAPEEGFAMGIVLAEGLETIGVSTDGALRKVLGDDIPVIGGHSGDHMLMDETRLFYNNLALKDSIIVVLLSGKVKFSMNVQSGVKPIGPRHRVDRCQNNIVHEIDGMTAADYFRQNMPSEGEDFFFFPLAVYSDSDSNDFVLRDPIEINHENGSVTFVGIFPENATIRMTEHDRTNIIHSSRLAFQNALKSYPGANPDLAMVFPCTFSRHVLGLGASQEHAALMQYREKSGMRFVGMYAYGELGPGPGCKTVCFHSCSYPVLLLGEDDE